MKDDNIFSPYPIKVWAAPGREVLLNCGVSVTDAGQDLKHITWEVAALIRGGRLFVEDRRPVSE